ncbi:MULTISPECIES: dihydrofolate reductase family protein [Aeromicrobium]|uniref:dihydrofolate reductase family protein n=1 Tax=Aeromicrobium TaxID=2040 RepID=UPI0006F7D8C1|nr:MULTISPECIES: dihydrofolate reductase family protein [Aeromicrobium]KQX73976.1 deaminase [Aeromicrobium sp. Root472D3]MCL8250841.1 dihydrofolate reductase family protein [Aeromicrobium fastidiosum]
MGRLIYSCNVSLDGYSADAEGRFDWSQPDEQVHAVTADLLRPMGTHLYGRRMYDVMVFWETVDDPDPFMVDFARLWRAADKVVYSRTLTEPSSDRTRIERDFDVDAVRALVEESATDVLIGGAELGGQAIAAGLVDELHTFVHPVLIGGGTRWLPDGVRVDLELVDEHRFGGVVHLHHRVSRDDR